MFYPKDFLFFLSGLFGSFLGILGLKMPFVFFGDRKEKKNKKHFWDIH